MFTFIWADGQASAVESLKTQNSNVKVQLEAMNFTLYLGPAGIRGTHLIEQEGVGASGHAVRTRGR